MDIVKVRELSDTELENALREAKQDLWQARFALSTRQLKDYSTIPQTRRTIARILTVQRSAPAPARRRREGDHAMTGATTQVQNKRKTKVGRVVSDKMDKTIVVSVERLARHPLYKRVIRLTTKFKAHDEDERRPRRRHRPDRGIAAAVGHEALAPRQRLQKAGEHGSSADIVADEAETSEAIHAAAHPGRTRAGADDVEAVEAAETTEAAPDDVAGEEATA
jgi:ribosomal protein L29